MSIEYVANTLKVITESISITGCSARMESIKRVRRDRAAIAVEKAELTANPFITTKTHPSTVAFLKRRRRGEDLDNTLSGKIFPGATVPKSLILKSNTNRGTNYLMCAQDDPSKVYILAHKTDELDEITDPKKQLPWWCLRPYKHFDIGALIEGGLFGKRRQHFKGDYKTSRDIAVRKKPKKNELVVQRGWGGDDDVTIPRFEQSVNSFDERRSTTPPQLSEQHISQTEWLKCFDFPNRRGTRADENEKRLPWWSVSYFQGVSMPTPEELVEGTLEYISGEIEDRESVGEKNPLIGFIGGNWKCATATDSIRVMLALYEAINWTTTTASGKCAYLVHKGRNIYLMPLPFIYESPVHRDHPVSLMVYSDVPMKWSKVE
jgi:hypothetical protein